MPEWNVWTPEQAEKEASLDKKRYQWTLGELMPISVRYLKWSPKPAEGEKKEPPAEISYEEFLVLEQQQRGEEVKFTIDPRIVNPTAAQVFERKVTRGFKTWRNITLPSINDAIGEGDKSLVEFAKRAHDGKWYIEAENVTDPQNQDFTTWKFTRMTQSQEVLFDWNAERYPNKEEEAPDATVETAKLVFTKMAKRDATKFREFVDGDPDLKPYSKQLQQLAATW